MIIFLKFLISFLWFFTFTKKLSFWVWLWQIKEYHIGRFFDHFNTQKGKKLVVNYFLFLKVAVLLGIFTASRLNFVDIKVFLVYFVFFIFFAEFVFVLKNFWQKSLKKPVLTRKVTLILSTGISFEILALFILFVLDFNIRKFVFALLFFDVASPLIFSVLVLVFQPFAVFLRNRIIKEAKKKRESFKNLTVVGITGSYGKTSTKEFLAEILSKKYKILKTEKNQNSEIGISQAILKNLTPQHEIFVCEMGAYNRGGIKLLSEIAKPKIGILTGINEQHMATFGSQENIIKGKYELIESLPETGKAIFNGDNNYCYSLFEKTNKPKFIYSLQSNIGNSLPDVWADKIIVDKDSLSFEVFSKTGESEYIKLNIAGKQNILNILGAICCAKELGMTLQEIAEACKSIKPEEGSLQIKKGMNDIFIIDSTYSANPDGVIADLDYLNLYGSKKVVIMPCLIELGKSSKKIHKDIGRKIGEVCDLAIITTEDSFKEIKEEAIKNGIAPQNILFLEDSKKIIEKVKNFCKQEDIVLLESRVPSRVIEELTCK
ncbi:MAG: UDP-N-acetylmuramoyl-tripeptide--D-alanyl-D-alanine ligase [Candidatus Nealsonbacteria bacterium]